VRALGKALTGFSQVGDDHLDDLTNVLQRLVKGGVPGCSPLLEQGRTVRVPSVFVCSTTTSKVYVAIALPFARM